MPDVSSPKGPSQWSNRYPAAAVAVRVVATGVPNVPSTETVAPGVPCLTDDRLIEMDYGPYEGMDLRSPAPEVIAFFMDFVNVPAPEGMEPLPDVVARLGKFLEEIREEAEGRNILISTRAIAMKGALEYLTPDSHGSYWATNIGNCVRPEVASAQSIKATRLMKNTAFSKR